MKNYIILLVFLFLFINQSIVTLSQCAPLAGVESIVNGNFENGDDGSSTFPSETRDDIRGSYTSPGQYTIYNDPHQFNLNNPYFPDHTKKDGTGNMLMIDGSTALNTVSWQQTVSVISFQTYYFSAWITSLFASQLATIEFRVKGNNDAGWTILGPSVQAPATVGEWLQIFQTWNSGNNTSATIQLVDANPLGLGTWGNDYAIDDISFINSCKNVSSGAMPKLASVYSLCEQGGKVDLNTGIPTNPNVTFTWFYNGTQVVTNPSTTNSLLNLTQTGIYTVCVDSANCIQKDTATIIAKLNLDLGPDLDLCRPSSTYLSTNIANANGLSLTWYKDGSIVKGANSTSLFVSTPGKYKLVVTDMVGNNCNASDSVNITTSAPVPVDANYCFVKGETTATLSVVGVGKFGWYDAATGGKKVGAGNSYTVTGLTGSDLTFYVKDTTVFSKTVGYSKNPGYGPGNNAETPKNTMLFTANSNFNIDSITFDLHSGTGNLGWAGKSINITYTDLTANTTISKTLNIVTPSILQDIVIPLKVGLQAVLGHNYSLSFNQTNPDIVGRIIPGTRLTFPKNDGQIVFTGYGTGGTDIWPGFYDWKISVGTDCDRVPVRVFNKCPVVCVLPTTLTATTLASSTACNGGNAIVTAANGSAPYYYLWNTGQITSSITGLSSGTYTVTVTDDNNCTVTKTAIRAIPPPFTASATATPVLCNGANNGTATVTASNGVLPYSYTWQGGGAGATKNNLAAGTYTVTVSDASGCTKVVSAVVNQPTTLTATITPSNIPCGGGSVGSASVVAANGTAPYTYNWSNGQNTTTATNLTSGNYTLTVTDANNCVVFATASIGISDNGAIISLINDTVTCLAPASGKLFVDIKGGASSFTTPQDAPTTIVEPPKANCVAHKYYINDNSLIGDAVCTGIGAAANTGTIGSPYDTWATLISKKTLAPGDTVYIENGTYSFPGSMNVNGSGTASCFVVIMGAGAANTKISVTGGGAALDVNTYSYVKVQDLSLTRVAGVCVRVATTSTNWFFENCNFTSTGVVSYVVYLNGANETMNNCNVTGDDGIFLESSSNNIIINKTNITGVTTNYFAFQSNCSNYSVTNCSMKTAGYGIDIAASGSNILFANNTVDASLTTTNLFIVRWQNASSNIIFERNHLIGNPAYAIHEGIHIDNGASNNNMIRNNYFTNMNKGISCKSSTSTNYYCYNNSFYTNGQCIGDYLKNWDIKDNIFVTTGVGAALQCVNINGVNQPTFLDYNVYYAPNGASIATRNGTNYATLLAWKNIFAANEANGKSGNPNFTAPTTGDLSIPIASIAENAGTSLAAVTNDIMASTRSNPPEIGAYEIASTKYTYLWNTTATTDTIKNLIAAPYTVTVSSSSGCILVLNANVIPPPPIVLSTIPTNANCAGGLGSIVLNVSGGTMPFTYHWDNAATTQNLTNLPAATYKVTVTDAVGCTQSATAIITEPTPIAATATPTNALCFGASTGSVALAVSGGIPPYNYNWSNFSATQNLTNLAQNTYTVTIKDANNCTQTATAVVSQPMDINTITATVDVLCSGGATGSINLSASGGTSPYSFFWSSGGTSQNLTNIIAGTYSVTVKDKNNCTQLTSATIYQPTPLVITASKTDALCFGGITGSLTVVANGGTTPYTYAWDMGSQTQFVQDLPMGTYNVVVTDANNCTKTASATISQPVAIATTISKTDVFCHGDSTGTITFSATGGTPPLAYLWNNASTTQNLAIAKAIAYTVTVTDGSNCTSSSTIVVSEPAAITLIATPTDAPCFGAKGNITLTPLGGKPAYTYNWDNGTSTQNLTNVAVGNYKVTLKDANACTQIASALVTQPTLLGVTVSQTDVKCAGGNSGSATLTITGGTGIPTFSWDNGKTSQNINTLIAGSYNVIVKDANACTATASIVISEPISLSVSLTKTDVLTKGASDGTVLSTVAGGTSPFSYLWSNGASTPDLNGVPSGTYTVTVTDINGCTTTASALINEPPFLTLIMTQTDVRCNLGNDGTATATITDGTAPYNYLWSNGGTTQTINNLTAGNYSVSVTDINNATAQGMVTISQPSPMIITTTPFNTQCSYSTDGSIGLTVNGGTGNYTYLWNNNSTSQGITNLIAGNYQVTVKDANLCTATATAQISSPNPILITATPTDAKCNNAPSGDVSLVVNGGTGNYRYQWNNGFTTNTISNLLAATYTVTVKDDNNCTTSATAIVSEPTPILATITPTNTSCNGSSDGKAILAVSGGKGSYTYLWNNAETTQDLTAIIAGDYTLTVTDINLCTTTATTTISENGTITATTIPTDVFCNGGSTGSLTLNASGGASPLTYIWNNGSTLQSLSNLSAAKYFVTITDANGCTHATSALVTQPDPLLATASGNDLTCNNAANGSVTAFAGGGFGTLSYKWSNGETTISISNLVAASYDVTVTDQNSCTQVANAILSEPSKLAITATAIDALSKGSLDGSISTTTTGGMPSYTYEWNPSATTPNLTAIGAGTYFVTVTDMNGCTATATAVVNEPPLIVVILSSHNVSCAGLSDGDASLSVSGGVPPYNYHWQDGSTLSTHTNLAAGTYLVTVTDANNAPYFDFITITQPSPIVLNTVATDASCQSKTDGTINLTVQGGTPIYTYAWDAPSNNKDLTLLGAGTYHVTVTDQHNRTKSTLAIVSQPALLSATDIVIAPICNGNPDGEIDLIVNGGTFPYTYLWNTSAASKNLTNVLAGTYDVSITDSKNCNTQINNIIISEPPVITIIPTQTNILCSGNPTGALSLVITGGTGAPTFIWNNNSTVQNLAALAAGTYKVTVNDAMGCTKSYSTTITQPGNPLTLMPNATDVLCNGDLTGTANVFPTGGSPSYNYTWSPILPNSPSQSSLGIGNYAVTVTDQNNCTQTTSMVISQPSPLNPVLTPQGSHCNGTMKGSILLVNTGGSPQVKFFWSNGMQSQSLSNLVAGPYSVTVIDGNNCSLIKSTIITDTGKPLLTRDSISDISCDGKMGPDGSAYFHSDRAVSYTWNELPGVSDSVIVNKLAAGQYTVIATDKFNCRDINTFRLNTKSGIVLKPITTTDFCGDKKATASVIVTGGTKPYKYLWNSAITDSVLTGLTKSVNTLMVTDAKDCFNQIPVSIVNKGGLVADIIHYPTVADIDNPAIQFYDNSTGEPAVKWLWTFGDSTKGYQRDMLHEYTDPNTFIVTLAVTDQYGCKSTHTDTLTINDVTKLYIPNTFTPNSDHHNDLWISKGKLIDENTFHVMVFDRWGEKIYESKDLYEGWNGRVNNTSDKVCQQGVYIYVINFNGITGRSYQYIGNVNLIY